jgi:hypothetical protein
MGIERKILSGLTLALVPTLSLAGGCSGEVIEPGGDGGSATCESVCSDIAACEPAFPADECAVGCAAQEEKCTSSEGSAAFQAFLDCVAGVSCTGGSSESYLLILQANCGSKVEAADLLCPDSVVVTPPSEDGGCCTVPPFDSGTDVEIDVSSSDGMHDRFDATPVDARVFDGPVDSSVHADAGPDVARD